jgi:thioredoxin-related protein
MRRIAYIMAAILLAAFAGYMVVAGTPEGDKKAESAPKADKIEWLSYDEGLELTKGSDKHMFVDITASWCGWCKKMDRETFTDPKVIELVNEHFVPVKLWGDSNEKLEIDGYKISQKDLATGEFKVTGYPSFWFLTPDLEKLGPLPGYKTAPQMVQVLEFVKDYKYDTTRAQNPGGEEKK